MLGGGIRQNNAVLRFSLTQLRAGLLRPGWPERCGRSGPGGRPRL